MNTIFSQLQQYSLDTLNLALYLDLFFRIIVSCFLGALIGRERSMRLKAAGIRTHTLIAATAALLMILSKYAFLDLTPGAFDAVKQADPARIAAQIITGVGFLGAGVIFVKGDTIHGLTTAAGIWATSGVGMAVGAGLYALGIFTTALVLILQLLLHKLKIGDDIIVNDIKIEMKDTPELRAWLQELFDTYGITIIRSKIRKDDNGLIALHLTVRMTREMTFEDSLGLMDANPDVRSFSL